MAKIEIVYIIISDVLEIEIRQNQLLNRSCFFMDWRGGRFKIVFVQENLLSSSTPKDWTLKMKNPV